MLTDREQRALKEIERGLSATDPRLSAKLARGSGRRRRRRSALEILSTITSVVLIATGAFDTRPGMIVAGVVGLAVLGRAVRGAALASRILAMIRVRSIR